MTRNPLGLRIAGITLAGVMALYMAGCSKVEEPARAPAANTTIGTATIASGSAEIVVANQKVTDQTLIYLTPISDTSNQVLYVKSKQAGTGFTVAVPASPSAGISFNYWLVETK